MPLFFVSIGYFYFMKALQNLHSLPRYSKLFLDFIAEEANVMKHFPNNDRLFKQDFHDEILDNYANRDRLASIFAGFSNKYELSKKQNENLEKLLSGNALTIISGQQPGFLGGAIYSLLKASTAIALADKLSAQSQRHDFVPIFWVEDNDHNIDEIGRTNIFDENYNLHHIKCFEDFRRYDQNPMSKIYFDEATDAALDRVKSLLPASLYRRDAIELIERHYHAGINVADSFLGLMNELLGEAGLLFVKASDIRKSGIIGEMLHKELSSQEEVQSIISARNNELISDGYSLQAKPSDINFFYHQAGRRISADQFSPEELLSFDKSDFSTKVMMRPIVQDTLFPNAAYIAGPSELAYWAQMTGLYQHYNVTQPALINRHFATFFDKNAYRFLQREALQPEYFFREFKELESELARSFVDREHFEIFNEARRNIESTFEMLSQQMIKLDTNLGKSSASSETKALRQIEKLEKKFISAHKKIKSDTIDSYGQISNYLYPNANYQERTFSPVSMIDAVGKEQFIHRILEIGSLDSRLHHFVSLF